MNLPPLPESTYLVPKLGKMSVNAYTADQMRAYGQACYEKGYDCGFLVGAEKGRTPKTLTNKQIDAIPFTGFTTNRGHSEAESLRMFARAIEAAVRGQK